jgi:hypothetical protein
VFFSKLALDLERQPTMLVSGDLTVEGGPRDTMPPVLDPCPSRASMDPSCWGSRGSSPTTEARAEQTFVHELVHELMHRALGETPPWLNEGMAQYFSTLRLEDDRAVLGDPSPDATAVPPSLLPTVSELTGADRDRFVPTDWVRAIARDAESTEGRPKLRRLDAPAPISSRLG